MCFLLSLLPATFWVVNGYFVLFSSIQGGGGDKNIRPGSSNLDLCDCSLFYNRRCLLHVLGPLSGHLKNALIHDVQPEPVSLAVRPGDDC